MGMEGRRQKTTSLRASLAMVAALGLAAVMLSACKKNQDDTSTDDASLLAEDGTDTSAVETDNELLSSSLISATAGGSLSLAGSSDLGMPGDIGTRNVGDVTKALYFPRGCLDVTTDDRQGVTYTFNDCSGPNGLFKIRGVVRATQTVSPGKLTLDLVATDLRINRATVDWHAIAEITAAGLARSMRWKAELSGTTARGRDFSRTNDKVVTWRAGDRCFTLSGTSEGDIKGRNIRTEIQNYARCQAACPEAGGSISITNVSTGTKVEIRFNGTDRAQFIGPRGDTTPFPLLCSG